jgi:hypothetical protein
LLAKYAVSPNGFQDSGGPPADTASKLKQEVVMTALVNALSRTFHSAQEIDALKQIALFCAAGLLVSLLLLTFGVDLSPGFF